MGVLGRLKNHLDPPQFLQLMPNSPGGVFWPKKVQNPNSFWTYWGMGRGKKLIWDPRTFFNANIPTGMFFLMKTKQKNDFLGKFWGYRGAWKISLRVSAQFLPINPKFWPHGAFLTKVQKQKHFDIFYGSGKKSFDCRIFKINHPLKGRCFALGEKTKKIFWTLVYCVFGKNSLDHGEFWNLNANIPRGAGFDQEKLKNTKIFLDILGGGGPFSGAQKTNFPFLEKKKRENPFFLGLFSFRQFWKPIFHRCFAQWKLKTPKQFFWILGCMGSKLTWDCEFFKITNFNLNVCFDQKEKFQKIKKIFWTYWGVGLVAKFGSPLFAIN